MDVGEGAVGVEKRKEEEEDAAGAEDGVLNNENPLPEDATEGPADGCTELVAGTAKLLNALETWLVGCADIAGKCNVG